MEGKKHIGRIVLIVMAVLFAGSIAINCVYAEKYRDTFIEGTYINGIDAGGMKVSEVEEVIKERVEDYYFDKEIVREKCSEYIAKMAQNYDKSYASVTFHFTKRGDITIPTEKCGYLIDEAGESAKLYELILERSSEKREPLYKLQKKPYSDLRNGTYVEVDIQNQHVYFYRNGSCVLDSACVTGKQTDSSSRTPTGYFSVIEKDTDRTLQGETDPSTGKASYKSFVNYWIRFYAGYGLHDASRRSNFGGDIYINSGSHGCVNLPDSAAKSLYSMVEYGTPVVVI